MEEKNSIRTKGWLVDGRFKLDFAANLPSMNVEPPLRGGGEATLTDKLGQSRFTGTTRRWRCCLVLFHLDKWTMRRLGWNSKQFFIA